MRRMSGERTGVCCSSFPVGWSGRGGPAGGDDEPASNAINEAVEQQGTPVGRPGGPMVPARTIDNALDVTSIERQAVDVLATAAVRVEREPFPVR